MKHASLLIALSAASLFACGKSEEAPAPAAEAEQAVPAAVAPVAEPPVAQPEAAPAAAPATTSKPTVEPAKAPSAPPSVTAPPVNEAAAKPDLTHGQQIYRQACAFCHDKGVAGAPKTGDTAAWSPRLAQGMDALVASAVRGKGAMPAKGGNPSLTDADIRAAVDYLAAQSR
jgi:cytochrome c5